jgi:spermidine/putrescine transport system ATP-binding protein
MDEPIVRLENIHKSFDGVVAVDHVNLDIMPGEFVTLLGPSGCGKTTTLRMINGLEMPTSGSVCLQGQDVTRVPPEKRPVNMVFQAYALFPHLTIYENIAFGPRIKKWPEDRIKAGIEEMLRLVQLEGYGPRKSDQLSGGQAQRVALARALINQPAVLLLDEPLGALDLKLRKAMQLELRGIQQRLGMTFVYVTHDQEEAMVMSDRIVLMNQGRVVQEGSPTAIYNHPVNEFVSRFIGEANLLDGVVASISGGEVTVDTNGLNILAPANVEVRVGQAVILSVRPERIQIFKEQAAAAQGWPNVFVGTVENAIFLGPTNRYHIRLSNEQSIVVDRATQQEKTAYQPGDQVVVGWETHSNVVLVNA